MTDHHDSYPAIEKRYSLLEAPDKGEKWPDGFDAITIKQKEGRLFKAKEARRFIKHFFTFEAGRRPDYLYGVMWHRQNSEHEAIVMIDTNNSYMRAKFLLAHVVGSAQYGYKVTGELDTLQDDESCPVEKDALLTYFSVPADFDPIEGEILGMMIGEVRDKTHRTV
jgi:hypothetical protein